MSSLSLKVILVIGGSSGIGFGVAKAALQEGAHVMIASSNQDKVTAAVARLEGPKQNVSGAKIDVNTEAGVRAFFEEHGAVDHVVYTAGDSAIVGQSFPNVDLDTSRHVFDVRYWGVLNVAKIAPKYIRRSLTMTGGARSIRPAKGSSLLAPVVGALPALSRALSLDLAPVRVNVITPGLIDTELIQGFGEETHAKIMAEFSEKQPVKHVADAEEIAEAYLFAMKCNYFTGQELVVDGGVVLV